MIRVRIFCPVVRVIVSFKPTQIDVLTNIPTVVEQHGSRAFSEATSWEQPTFCKTCRIALDQGVAFTLFDTRTRCVSNKPCRFATTQRTLAVSSAILQQSVEPCATTYTMCRRIGVLSCLQIQTVVMTSCLDRTTRCHREIQHKAADTYSSSSLIPHAEKAVSVFMLIPFEFYAWDMP